MVQAKRDLPGVQKNKLFGDEHICPECLARKAMYRANNPISDEKQKQYNERFKNSSGRCTNNEKNKVFVPVVVNAQRQSLKPNVQYA